ncbi:NYN domain-containing protein [Paraglaciecola hydrolytica]|uniref:Nuclease n=1 Tax=Paraglaciecola hydrolytica TaxID=1799789 RepID=A0A136A6B3_9ALTE|nr:NYN domain-containing protein [Paraglaciecola hydrolytica]KXI30766.1 nuclease [Paraglaciecola hydrolytica]
MPKIAILVDVQNIYYTTRDAFAKQFNYRAFWQQISQQGEIVIAKAYAIDKGDTQQEKFQSALRHIGFDVKLKPYIQRSDGSAKGDWDVGITIDALIAAEQIDTLVLLSGDGDFDLLLLTLKQKYQCNTIVYGVAQLTATSLVNAADHFVKIDNDLLL